MKDYKEVYGNEIGACASCRHIKTLVKGASVRSEDVLIDYDGGKHAVCNLKYGTSIVMRDTPDMSMPVSDCWESK